MKIQNTISWNMDFIILKAPYLAPLTTQKQNGPAVKFIKT